MDTRALQTWLKNHGYYKGKIDGINGPQTKAALRAAQTRLAQSGLYKKQIDGKYGGGTEAAIRAWDRGNKFFNIGGKRTYYNVFDRASVENVVRALRNRGYNSATFNGRKIALGDRDVVDQVMALGNDVARGIRSSTIHNLQSDRQRGSSVGAVATSHSSGRNGGGSSFSTKDLDNLVLRYVYDVYHGTPVDKNQWGIEYDYTPHSWRAATTSITLKIDPKKWNASQAQQIARGAGMSDYIYGGKKYYVNLFQGTGSKYRDLNDFNNKIAALQKSKGAKVAQQAYNAELQRQYNTYGIDFNMLKNKTRYQWNNLMGVVPYGYNSESIGAIARGKQAEQRGSQSQATASGLGASNVGYRYTGSGYGTHGRFAYNNFDQWYAGRMLANSRYGRNGGISATRAVTSTYYMGLPVARQMRGQLRFVGANPNGNSIDRTNYYAITDKSRGSSKMQAWIYNEVARNPAAAYKYFQYIYGDRNSKNHITGDRSRKFDNAQASRLATAAGLTPYHLSNTNGAFIDTGSNILTGSHDLWDSLKTFYENGFDANGNLLKDFNYTENGYNNNFDGGAYTVRIRGGKPMNAEDSWDVSLQGFGAGLNSGINGKGLPLITRFLNGGLLKYIQGYQHGGGLKGGKKRGDSAGTLWCATWSNGLLRNNGYMINGDAWDLHNVDTVYSGYDTSKKPKTYDRTALEAYNAEATDSVYRNFDSKELDKSRPYVVNMYYKGSDKQKDAYENGNDVTGTHTGVLTYENGRWMVTHNIHGTIHQDPFISLQNKRGKWGVTAIYAPRRKNIINQVRKFFGLKYGGLITRIN